MVGFKFPVIPEQTFFRIAILLCLLFALNGIIVQLFELPLHILKSVNEGFNAYFAARAMGGMPLYPRPPALILNNYPPLSFYLIGLVGKLVGDYVIAGRLVSMISFFGIAGLLGLIVARQTASRRIGVFIAAYFGAVFSVFPGDQIGLNAPQILAHAVMLGGFAVFWFGGGRFSRTMIGAALMVTAGLIKHNIFSLPIAITVWLALSDRKQFYYWLAAAGLSLMIAMLALTLLWGPGALDSILVARPISLTRSVGVIFILREILPSLTILLLLLVWPSEKLPGQGSAMLFCTIYVAISLVVAFTLFGGEGMGSNAAFDVAISVVMTIGFRIGALPVGQERRAVIVALVLAQYFMIPWGVGSVAKGAVASAAQRDRGDIAYLAAYPGNAICSDPTLCFWANKDFLFDFFNLPVLYEMKRRDPEIFSRKLLRHDFSVIALDKASDPPVNPWFIRFRKELETSYRLERTSSKHLFFVPK